MSILNEKTNETKTRETKNIFSKYITTKIEGVNDFILLASLSFNSILINGTISTNEAIAGLMGDIVLLDGNKNELTTLKSDISFATKLDNSTIIDSYMKFKTLGEYIVEKTEHGNYTGQVFIALKIKTPASEETGDVKILTEINFIENI